VSGEAILPFFRTSLGVEDKGSAAGFDPVTAADRAAEVAMRTLIKRNFPAHGVVGEEYGNERADAEYVWVLDPIDGTRAFVSGRPTFGTLIALLDGDTPIVGIIDQPVTRERWIGRTLFGSARYDLPIALGAYGSPLPKRVPQSYSILEPIDTSGDPDDPDAVEKVRAETHRAIETRLRDVRAKQLAE